MTQQINIYADTKFVLSKLKIRRGDIECTTA